MGRGVYNSQIQWNPDIIHSLADEVEDITKLRLPSCDPEAYLGYQFGYQFVHTDDNGEKIKAKVKISCLMRYSWMHLVMH